MESDRVNIRLLILGSISISIKMTLKVVVVKNRNKMY